MARECVPVLACVGGMVWAKKRSEKGAIKGNVIKNTNLQEFNFLVSLFFFSRRFALN